MKVAVDAKRAFNNNTGLGDYSRTLIRALAKQKEVESLFLMNSKTNKSIFNKPLNTQVIEPFISNKLTSAYWRKNIMGKKALKLNAHVFHGLSAELPYFGKRNSIKKIVTIHDLIFLSNPEFYNSYDRKIYAKKTKKAIDNADSIVAISQFTANLIKQEWNVDKPIKVIHPIIENSGFLLNGHQKSKNKDYLLYISSFQKRKNHKKLINVFAQWEHLKTINLILAGRPGETLTECKTLIKKHGLEKNIFIKTNIDSQEKQNLLYNAKGFVYPSEIEGFGIPLIESLHQQTKILCPDIPIYKEVAGQYAKYYSSEGEMLTGLSDLVSEKTNWNGLDVFLNKYSEKFVGNQLVELYRSKLE